MNVAHSASQSSANLNVKLPHYFEINKGQQSAKYRYLAHTKESNFGFTNKRIDISIKSKTKFNSTIASIEIINALTTSVKGEDKLQNLVNYLRGEKKHWVTDVETFSKLKYQNVYQGIDLAFYFSNNQLEFDFIVSPGTDPSIIALKYNNVKNLTIDPQGALQFDLDGEIIRQKPPVIYQLVGEEKQIVSGKYKLAENEVRFQLAAYNPEIPLIIDPVIEFASYYGGEWEDQANAIQVDSSGNVWLAGSTAARARITEQNILTQENIALGVLEESGGTHFFQAEHGISLPPELLTDSWLDLDNELILSPDNPDGTEFVYDCDYRYSNFFSRDTLVSNYDAFISKFDANMNPIFTTYFGGCRNDGVRGMTIDANDNIYLAGFTLSDDLPITGSSQSNLAPSRFDSEPVQADAFYAKFDNNGELLFSSYLGGDGRDGARDIAVDADENIYIVGYTHSTNLRATPCDQNSINVIACDNIGGVDDTGDESGSTELSLYADAFVAKVAAQGDVISFLTYFGGEFDDWGQAIALASDGVIIAGNTASSNLAAADGQYSYMAYNRNIDPQKEDPVEEPCSRLKTEELLTLRQADAHVCEDVFLTKLSLDGTSILFTTYLGGVKDDNVSDLSVDANGNIYLIGTTRSQGVRLPDGESGTRFNLRVKDANGVETNERSQLLNMRFPLYKNINQFPFDVDSLSTMAFVSILTPDADRLIFSTYIGGNNDDAGIRINVKNDVFSNSVLRSAKVFLGGHTISDHFYSLNAFQQRSQNSDIFLMNLFLDLTKIDDPYDPASDTCNATECDLYRIDYSTLIGGENLDAMKDMIALPTEDAILMTGTTFSRFLPVTDDAVKSELAAIVEKEFDPFSGELVDQYNYYPSDMFLAKISDRSVVTDLTLTFDESNNDEVRENQFIEYNIELANTRGLIVAESVAFSAHFPFVAVESKLADAVQTNLSDCILELRQLVCRIGDMAADETRSINVKIKAANSGDFSAEFSVRSATADIEMSNNSLQKTTKVRATAKSSLAMGLLPLFATLFYFRHKRRKLFP